MEKIRFMDGTGPRFRVGVNIRVTARVRLLFWLKLGLEWPLVQNILACSLPVHPA